VVEPTPLKKYESQLGLFFPIYGKIKHVPNHQLGIYIYIATCKKMIEIGKIVINHDQSPF